MLNKAELFLIAYTISGNFEPDPYVDDDPDFRNVLEFLNDNEFTTRSSCQGHPPGTKYDDVQEWMDPYITFQLSPEKFKKIVDTIIATGYYTEHNDKQYVGFSNDIIGNWKDFLSKLKAEIGN